MVTAIELVQTHSLFGEENVPLWAETDTDTPTGRTPAITLADRLAMLEADAHSTRGTLRNLAAEVRALRADLNAHIADLDREKQRLDALARAVMNLATGAHCHKEAEL